MQKNLRFGLRQLNPHVFDLKGVGVSAEYSKILLRNRCVRGNRKSESKPEDKPGGSSSAPVQWDKNFREWTLSGTCINISLNEDLHGLTVL